MHLTEDTRFQGVAALLVVAWLVRRQLAIKRIGKLRFVLPLVLVVLGLVPPGPAAA